MSAVARPASCRGHGFLSLNKGLLDQYAACATASEVIETQTAYLASLEAGAAHRHRAGRGAWVGVGDPRGRHNLPLLRMGICDK